MKIKISNRATHAHNELMLLQNVSTRVWQNLVVFRSVVNRQDFFFNSGSCMRPAAAVPGLDRAERPAMAVAGSNGLNHILLICSLGEGKKFYFIKKDTVSEDTIFVTHRQRVDKI